MQSRKPREILHSKRGNLQYLEHCRVLVKEGRVLFLRAEKGQKENAYWNIPVANTTAVLLGTGTSITQAAVRMMAEAGVMIGFCGGGGTPLISSTEVEWFSPQSEYRPTEYVQAWLKFWFDDRKRLQIARFFQSKRIEFLKAIWGKDSRFKEYGFDVEDMRLDRAFAAHQQHAKNAENVTQLLTAEGRLAKELYKHAANATGQQGFVRDPDKTDLANQFLSHGNYLAYGSAATCLWCLGIPHGFAVMHGKTRRGALVFDVADLVKDAIILPLAFIASAEGLLEREFREECLEAMTRHQSLDFMFDVVKAAAQRGDAMPGGEAMP
ncbi:CRISPR-associated endonuclease Cas1 [Rubripirellula obstinata]|uniref:CRISPR-associated endonuclease Cas1 n=1 Tax=Rubripirellula obstinata TaxID=406547 RepID=A0A5B1CMH4_9BACT|nr:type I-F CRISPR-associated endonuclease Cas1f [Rubripirellula obstinata]KAA1260534.1 CRISPR-associated endonuclease Cas1 [Rubripirellula obstinata]